MGKKNPPIHIRRSLAEKKRGMISFPATLVTFFRDELWIYQREMRIKIGINMGFNETNGEYGIYMDLYHGNSWLENYWTSIGKNTWNPRELRGIIQWNIPVKRCVMLWINPWYDPYHGEGLLEKTQRCHQTWRGRWICPRHGHLSGLYWDSYLLLIIIPGFGRSEVVIIYPYLYMGKTWNWMGDFPVSHVWLRKGKQHKNGDLIHNNGNIRLICREYSGLSKKGAKKVFLNEAYINGNHGFNAVMGICGSQMKLKHVNKY